MENTIRIPKRLDKFLKKDKTWFPRVRALCNNVEELLSFQPKFFPNYTIHNVKHVNDVLRLANRLIPNESFSKDPEEEDEAGLTPRDIAYLVSAIVIHDLGMFLYPASVQQILSGAWPAEQICGSDDKAWTEEWDAYIRRAKRYSAEKKIVLFGSDIAVDRECYKKNSMEDNDYLLIGEFLRQHHPRLAHEIAVSGMPGSQTECIFRDTGFRDNDRRIIGFLARSHGMSLRDAEKFMTTYFEKDAPRILNVPVLYLVAVIRIADYLDAGEHRAPVSREHLQEIGVAVSKDEWNWNQRIVKEWCSWNTYQKKREIYAEPKNSIEYFQLEKWLNGVQAELNVCWAMLAEKYANEPYRLSIHRITCSIEDSRFQDAKKRDFLAKEARLSANPKILDLLIAPLYGSDPSYGVRELVQNAVDACVEREFYEQEHSENGEAYSGQVCVAIDTKANTFTISDNGIGMDENVLLNYYLAAGASYRLSDEWKQKYSKDDRSQVARTGKFGVGFLAAFLLGDTITVSTRHRNDDRGYRFSFGIQAKPLNIECVKLDTFGTTIKIDLKQGVLEQLLRSKDSGETTADAWALDENRAAPAGSVNCWNTWYTYDDPAVTYSIDGETVSSGNVTIRRKPEDNTDWFAVRSDAFEFCLWRYLPRDHAPRFYCNGIRIQEMPGSGMEKYGMAIPFPQIAVSDPNAVLDIDLARSRVQTFPEEARLAKEVARYQIARLLMTDWSTDAAVGGNLARGFVFAGDRRSAFTPYLLMPHGFLPYFPDVCRRADCERYVALLCTADPSAAVIGKAHRFVEQQIPVSIVLSGHKITTGAAQRGPGPEMLDRFLNSFVPSRQTPGMLRRSQHTLMPPCSNLWIAKDFYPSISQLLAFELPGNANSACAHVHAWRLNRRRIPDAGEMPIDCTGYDHREFPMAVEMACEERRAAAADSLFLRQVLELLTPDPGHPQQDMWIPYRMDERKKKFPKAFEELKYYMDRL